jgi:STE24 endopeptidase
MYFWIILLVLAGSTLLEIITEYLNIKNLSQVLPKEFEGYYDAEKYANSQKYARENTRFQLIQTVLFSVITVSMILSGGFNYIDLWCRGLEFKAVTTGLVFCGVLGLGMFIINIPFSIYKTFVIEEKYGFNKTSAMTFVFDTVKGLILSILLGGLILSLVLLFFRRTGDMAWLYSWGALTTIQLVGTYLAPAIFMPLFNKFNPIEDGELKTSIEEYAKKQKFALKGVYKMDGSKRSTKANAFFTGFGNLRKIVLFDTLIEKFSVDELVSILAHEMGHFKLKHIFKMVSMSIINTGVMFFMLSLFINNEGLFTAFKMDNLSIYASLIFFGMLYTPLQLIISIFTMHLSRQYEYQADQYAVETVHKPEEFIEGLKKLSVDHLANLSPHPLKVWQNYSHPPILERIKAIRSL